MATGEKRTLIVRDDTDVIREGEVIRWMATHEASVPATAEEFGCSASNIRRILRENGVKVSATRTSWAVPESLLNQG